MDPFLATAILAGGGYFIGVLAFIRFHYGIPILWDPQDAPDDPSYEWRA